MKTKPTVLMLSTLLAAFALLASPAGAEPAAAKEAKAEQGPKGQRGDRLEKMKERLGLTEAQVAQLKPIFAAEREELKALREELGKDASREERREAMREVHEKYRPQIEAVLTAEQKEKIAKVREREGKKKNRPEGAGPE